MKTSDTEPPSPSSALERVLSAIAKLRNKHDMLDYLEHLTTIDAHHLFEVTNELKERLLLQGLDDDDLYHIHEFLQIGFDGDLIKSPDPGITIKRAGELAEIVNT